jgi:hypothetical protein
MSKGLRRLGVLLLGITGVVALLALVPGETDAQQNVRAVITSITAGDTDIGNVDLELAGTAVSHTNRVPTCLSDGVSACVAITADPEDEDAFTYATTKVVPIGAVAESTTDALADGTVGAPVMTLLRQLRMVATGSLGGGGTPVNMISDGVNNDDETAICTGPCTVYSIVAFNHTAASAFLRCENDTAGNTTPGSEANGDGEFDLEIPASTTGAGFSYLPGGGIGASFATALTCWIVSEEAATGTTDVAADDVRVQFVRVQ